jgi:hypothetical protein
MICGGGFDKARIWIKVLGVGDGGQEDAPRKLIELELMVDPPSPRLRRAYGREQNGKRRKGFESADLKFQIEGARSLTI